MSLYSGRKELKFLVNEEKLKEVIKYISLTTTSFGGYSVNNYYIAEWRQKKKHGRLRIREYDNGTIFLEEKVNRNGRQTKHRHEINREASDYLKYADWDDVRRFINNCEFKFSRELMTRGESIYVNTQYERTEFTIEHYDEVVRMTVDSNVRSFGVELAPHLYVLEVKVDGFSRILKNLIYHKGLRQSKFGKYRASVGMFELEEQLGD